MCLLASGRNTMTDRVLVTVPGLGVLALARDVFTEALLAGAELSVTAPASHASAVEPLLDSKDAAAQLGIESRWLEDSARAGIIPHHKFGRYTRFRVSEVAAHCRIDGAAIPTQREPDSPSNSSRMTCAASASLRSTRRVCDARS